MKLHGEDILLGDRVYDLTASRGYGRVVKIHVNGWIEAVFGLYTFLYDTNGIQKGKPITTLYWDRPVVISPPKNELAWIKKQELITKFFDLVRDYARYI